MLINTTLVTTPSTQLLQVQLEKSLGVATPNASHVGRVPPAGALDRFEVLDDRLPLDVGAVVAQRREERVVGAEHHARDAFLVGTRCAGGRLASAKLACVFCTATGDLADELELCVSKRTAGRWSVGEMEDREERRVGGGPTLRTVGDGVKPKLAEVVPRVMLQSLANDRVVLHAAGQSRAELGQRASRVGEEDLESRVSVVHAGEDQPGDGDRRLEREARC